MESANILRSLVLFTASACFGTGTLAQTPGTADPVWNTVRQGPVNESEQEWSDIAAQPSGKLLVAGRGNDGSGVSSFVWRYERNGALDGTFGAGGAARILHMYSPKLVTDGIGRIYVYGRSMSASSDSPPLLIRLLADGAIDTSFGSGQPIALPGANDVALLPDGRILAVSSEVNNTIGQEFIRARRLLADGSIDASFGTNGVATLFSAPPNGAVGRPEVEVMADGRFVVVFPENTSIRDTTARLHKFTVNGAPDSSFRGGGAVVAPGLSASDLELQPDGMILLVVRNGQQDTMIARLTPGGNLDSSFGSGGLAAGNTRQFLQIEPDASGGIIVATTGTSPGAMGAPTLMRLTANGVVDDSFASPPMDQPGFLKLALGDGAYALTILRDDTFIASRALRKFVLAPGARTGSVNTDNTPSTARFRIEARNLADSVVSSVRTTEIVGLHGFVYPQAVDVNTSADVFVVAGTSQGFYMRNINGAFVRWDGVMSSLVPAYENVSLHDNLYVSVYSGRLPFTGTFQLYLGYMRDGGPLIYAALPTPLTVTP